MIDIHIVQGNGPHCQTEGQEIKLGTDGRRGNPGADALTAAVLMCQGSPETALDLGPYFLPPGGEQSFTSDNSICGCLAAPAADWVATIWRNSVLVGSAIIPAGQTVGVVELFNDGFTVVSPQVVNAVCPIIVDPTIKSPSITLG